VLFSSDLGLSSEICFFGFSILSSKLAKIAIALFTGIDSFPSSDFGVIEGEIIRIGSDALPPEPRLNKGYRFPAIIKLDNQKLTLKSGKKLPLQAGMSITANIKLRKVSYLQLLLNNFSDKADSIKQL